MAVVRVVNVMFAAQTREAGDEMALGGSALDVMLAVRSGAVDDEALRGSALDNVMLAVEVALRRASVLRAAVLVGGWGADELEGATDGSPGDEAGARNKKETANTATNDAAATTSIRWVRASFASSATGDGRGVRGSPRSFLPGLGFSDRES
jgi:hypothetical protein